MRTLFVAVVLSAFTAFAGDELSPEKLGQIEHEQNKAAAEVEKKYGNKKPSELSSDERKQMIKDRAAAEQAVLDKHGVDKKDYVHAQTRMNRDDREQASRTTKNLEKKELEDAAKAKGGQKEVQVEHGLPPEEGGVNEAAEMDKQMGYGKGSDPGSGKKKR
ncbi:MAG: hypothetical protein QM723_23670 [Myxococcaceae bacterium]